METELLMAVLAILTAVGGGAWKLIQRADSLKAVQEGRVIEMLREQVADRDKRIESLKDELKSERRRSDLLGKRMRDYREQLIDHDIKPIPPDAMEGIDG